MTLREAHVNVIIIICTETVTTLFILILAIVPGRCGELGAIEEPFVFLRQTTKLLQGLLLQALEHTLDRSVHMLFVLHSPLVEPLHEETLVEAPKGLALLLVLLLLLLLLMLLLLLRLRLLLLLLLLRLLLLCL